MFSVDEKALRRALRFIDYRPRTSDETRQRLRRWGYCPVVVDEVVDYLQSRGLIDDAVFARLFTEEMLLKGFGCRRVRDELFKKKLSGEIIEEVMSKYPHEDEFERARSAAASRISRLINEKTSARRMKLKRYLMRRGYTPDVAEEACRSVIVDTQLGPE